MKQAAACPHVRLRGLMTILRWPAPTETARFCKNASAFVDIRSQMDDNKTSFTCLSMGMSGDYENAVREGATLVRVGTALFGPVPHAQGIGITSGGLPTWDFGRDQAPGPPL